MRTLEKKVILFILAVVILTALFNMRIKYVEVEGNTLLSDTEIESVLIKNDIERKSFFFYLKNKFTKGKTLPYISNYHISWKTPSYIVITVIEKPAIAFTKCDLKNAYFDRDGVINEVSEEVKNDAMEITGVDFNSYKKGDRISAKDTRLVNALINIAKYLYDNKLPAKSIEVDKKGNVIVYIGNISIVLGDIQNMEIKLQRLNDIYAKISNLSGTLYLSNAKENMIDEQYVFKKSY